MVFLRILELGEVFTIIQSVIFKPSGDSGPFENLKTARLCPQKNVYAYVQNLVDGFTVSRDPDAIHESCALRTPDLVQPSHFTND